MIDTKIKTREELAKISENFRSQGKTIGFTSGAFDILHAGHVRYLEDAKKNCDALIVGLNSDESVKKYKGNLRPLTPQDQRAQVVAALSSVDFVFIFNERRNAENISALKPNLYIKAGDYKESELTSKEVLEKFGGKILLIPIVEDISTTQIIQKITAITETKKAITHTDGSTHIEIPKGKAKPAIFLDRDGTINDDTSYLHDPCKLTLLSNALAGMKKMQDMGFWLIIVTNQTGIGLGYHTKEDFYNVNRTLFKILAPEKIVIERIYFCPHGKNEKCNCRKPNTELLQRAQKDLPIDMANSWFIGDKTSDIECGKRAGIKTIRIKTENPDSEYKAKPDFEAKDLLEAAEYILASERK